MAAMVPQMSEGYSCDGSTLIRREYFDRSMETGARGIYTTAEDLLRWNKALDSHVMSIAAIRRSTTLRRCLAAAIFSRACLRASR
jgi:hypothetical protein